MRKISLPITLVFCLITLACHGAIKKEVNAYIEERQNLIVEMGKAVEANPTNAGVDEARKIFEAKRADLKKKQDELFKKDIPFNLVQIILDSTVSDNEMLNSIGNKIKDIDANQNFTKLQNEFSQAFHR